MVERRVDLDDLPPLSLEQEARLKKLADLSDEDIDVSDLPDITDWSNAVRGKFYRPVKKQVTLRLDADMLQWFKSQTKDGKGYQTHINAVLRKAIMENVRN